MSMYALERRKEVIGQADREQVPDLDSACQTSTSLLRNQPAERSCAGASVC